MDITIIPINRLGHYEGGSGTLIASIYVSFLPLAFACTYAVAKLVAYS